MHQSLDENTEDSRPLHHGNWICDASTGAGTRQRLVNITLSVLTLTRRGIMRLKESTELLLLLFSET